MCYIFQENEITPIKAEEDIRVFKIGHLSCGGFISINRGALYQFKQVRTAERFWERLIVSPFEGEYMTGPGLYSIATEEKAKEYLNDILRFARSSRVFKARIYIGYIPKGSYYLKTDDDMYISDNLVVLNKVFDYYPKLSEKFWELHGEMIRAYVPENIIPREE